MIIIFCYAKETERSFCFHQQHIGNVYGNEMRGLGYLYYAMDLHDHMEIEFHESGNVRDYTAAAMLPKTNRM